MTDQLIGTILAGGGGGVIATLLLILSLILAEKLVVGKAHVRERERADRFEKTTLSLLRTTARAVEAVPTPAVPAPGGGDDD